MKILFSKKEEIQTEAEFNLEQEEIQRKKYKKNRDQKKKKIIQEVLNSLLLE
jgi:hypothetical protein